MKNFIKSFRLTLVFCVFFSVCYILVLWIFAQFAGPNSGNAEVVELNGKVVGAANVGQSFTEDIYFWGRPSCAGDGYDATSSAGSNKGPTNAEYLAEVEARIDTFLKHHPYLSRKEVPAEMVTASGSGLDPDITPACAYVQVQRVAKARGMSEETVKAIVDKAVEKPFMGIFGTEKVNVLKLNAALEKAKYNIHIRPSVCMQLFIHHAGSLAHFLIIYRKSPAIPTVPSHRRSQSNPVSYFQGNFFFGYTFFVHGFQKHFEISSKFGFSRNKAGGSI